MNTGLEKDSSVSAPQPFTSSTRPPRRLDPRPEQSRARLLEAAIQLLHARGPSAVTIDGVLRTAHVARATLYRHFAGGSHDLFAATFDKVTTSAPQAPEQGPLEARLRALVLAQAETIAETPPHVTAMYWLSIGSDMEKRPCVNGLGSAPPDRAHSLRERLAVTFSAPLAGLLSTPEAKRRFGDVDTTVAFALLVGPLVLGRTCTVAGFDYRRCAESAVEGFLQTHTRKVADDPNVDAATTAETVEYRSRVVP